MKHLITLIVFITLILILSLNAKTYHYKYCHDNIAKALKIPPDSSAELIQSTFKKMTKQLHPDKLKNPTLSDRERYQKIVEYYQEYKKAFIYEIKLKEKQQFETQQWSQMKEFFQNNTMLIQESLKTVRESFKVERIRRTQEEQLRKERVKKQAALKQQLKQQQETQRKAKKLSDCTWVSCQLNGYPDDLIDLLVIAAGFLWVYILEKAEIHNHWRPFWQLESVNHTDQTREQSEKEEIAPLNQKEKRKRLSSLSTMATRQSLSFSQMSETMRLSDRLRSISESSVQLLMRQSEVWKKRISQQIF